MRNHLVSLREEQKFRNNMKKCAKSIYGIRRMSSSGKGKILKWGCSIPGESKLLQSMAASETERVDYRH